VNPYLLLVLEALLFALVFGLLSWLRGEGLAAQFAWESLGFAAVVLVVTWPARIAVHPVLFLVLIYVWTMRARLLADLGNAFSARGRYEQARSIFHLALRLGPDSLSRTIVRINEGVVLVRQKRMEEAIALLNDVLAHLPTGRGSPKYEAAGRYNLGFAYLRAGEAAKARREFEEVIALLPLSLYARAAESALKKQRGSQSQGP